MLRILDKEVEYIFPEEQLAQEWFAEFNERFFGNELPPIEVRCWHCEKNTRGVFYHPRRETGLQFNPDQCSISLNTDYFCPVESWRNTFLHEMVHYYVYMKHGHVARHHGKEFNAVARRIKAESGINITTHFEGLLINPGQTELNAYCRQEDNDFVVCDCRPGVRMEMFHDDETGADILIERSDAGFVFKTLPANVPHIIANFHADKDTAMDWYRVKACEQAFLLMKGVGHSIAKAHPSALLGWCINPYDPSVYKYGKLELEELGRTTFSGGEVTGFNPKPGWARRS